MQRNYHSIYSNNEEDYLCLVGPLGGRLVIQLRDIGHGLKKTGLLYYVFEEYESSPDYSIETSANEIIFGTPEDSKVFTFNKKDVLTNKQLSLLGFVKGGMLFNNCHRVLQR